MSLIDEIQKAKDESYDKWFERWYEKLGLEKQILQSAQEGYSGYVIAIKRKRDSTNYWTDREKYEARRKRDSRTVDKIKEKLGEGFTVNYSREDYETSMFGLTQYNYEDNIKISWGVKE